MISKSECKGASANFSEKVIGILHKYKAKRIGPNMNIKLSKSIDQTRIEKF